MRSLKFTVGTALLVAPLATGCASSGTTTNVAPPPDDYVNEGPVPEPPPEPVPEPTSNPAPEVEPTPEPEVNTAPEPEP